MIFKDIRDLISKVDLVEILFSNAESKTYHRIDEVPTMYDNLEVKGIGPILTLYNEKFIKAQEIYLDDSHLKDAITLTNKEENYENTKYSI